MHRADCMLRRMHEGTATGTCTRRQQHGRAMSEATKGGGRHAPAPHLPRHASQVRIMQSKHGNAVQNMEWLCTCSGSSPDLPTAHHFRLNAETRLEAYKYGSHLPWPRSGAAQIMHTERAAMNSTFDTRFRQRRHFTALICLRVWALQLQQSTGAARP